jgi:hypothetical protein
MKGECSEAEMRILAKPWPRQLGNKRFCKGNEEERYSERRDTPPRRVKDSANVSAHRRVR